VTRLEIIGVAFVLTLLAITYCWAYGLKHGKDLSVIDGFYGFGFLLHGVVTLALWHEWTARGVILTVLIAAWAIGFGQHMIRRWFRHHGTGGDERYRMLFEKLKISDIPGRRRGFWWKSYVIFGAPQAVFITLLSLPFQLAIMSEAPGLGPVEVLGFVVLAAGGLVEVVSNRQLELFGRRDPATRSRTLTNGLWAWSRHPNYFGNVIVYLGSVIVAVGAETNLWWTIISPLSIAGLFLIVSIPMIDKMMEEKRANDPDYLLYVELTPAFFLRPPKRSRLLRATP
jgi:steroid 5-alpha reductase family enzyme